MDKVAEEHEVRLRLAELERAFGKGDEKKVLAMVVPGVCGVRELSPSPQPSLRILLQRQLDACRSEAVLQHAGTKTPHLDVPVKLTIEVQNITFTDRRDEHRRGIIHACHLASVESLVTLIIGNKSIWQQVPRKWVLRKDESGWGLTAIVFPDE